MTTPPSVAPLNARLTARPRRRSHQGASTMLIAAPLIAPQPSDITTNGGIELPRLRDDPERRHPGGHGDAPASHDDARTVAAVHVADQRGQERPGDVVHGDGQRHGRCRPAVQALKARHVHGESVEAQPEAEQRHHEGGAPRRSSRRSIELAYQLDASDGTATPSRRFRT